MIRVDHEDGVAVVRLEHGKVNALDVELLRTAAATVRDLSSADAIVITGRDSAFSAGVDLRRVLDGGPEYAAELVDAISDAALALFDHPRPTVAAINGHAIAGGCVLAAACDVRLMSGGSIGVTEVRVGVLFPTAPLEVVRHACGPAADELVLSGRLLDADAAQRCGLVHEVVAPDALLGTAVRRARDLSRVPASVYAATKQQLHRDTRRRITENRDVDNARVVAAWQDPQTLVTMRSFLERVTRAGTRAAS
jgi:enoyl-CoA hydratase